MANIDSSQIGVTVNVAASGARKRRKRVVVELDGTQSNNDVIRFFTIRSGDYVDSLLLSCDALAGATDVNFGLRLEDGTDVDENLFDDAQTLTGPLVRQEKRVGTNSALNIDTLGKPVYQLLGLSDDPFKTYVVTADLVAAGSASGTIVLEMDYTAGD